MMLKVSCFQLLLTFVNPTLCDMRVIKIPASGFLEIVVVSFSSTIKCQMIVYGTLKQKQLTIQKKRKLMVFFALSPELLDMLGTQA